MPITNFNTVVIDLPVWEVLQPAPAATGNGVCMATDKRGNNRYVYLLVSATSFWRYDLWSNTYQQLASPPGGTIGPGTAMTFDPSRGTSGYVWALISSGVGAPTWQYYDIAANAWTARAITNLPATFGTDAHLSHTCSTYNVAGNDDFIYLIGNNATAFYRFSISGNTWTTLTVVTAAPGAGCSIHWMTGYNTDKLVCIRGGATSTIYEYNITANTWATLTYNPSTETFTTGTMAVSRGSGSTKLIIQKDATMRCFQFDLSTLTMTPLVTQYLIAPGAAVTGDRFVYVKETNNIEFLYMGLHTSTNFLRSPLFF